VAFLALIGDKYILERRCLRITVCAAGASLGRDLNSGSRPYQDVDTFRGLKTVIWPSSDNTFLTDFSSRIAVLVLAVYPVAGGFLRRLSIITHPLQTPGKQALGLTHNTSSPMRE